MGAALWEYSSTRYYCRFLRAHSESGLPDQESAKIKGMIRRFELFKNALDSGYMAEKANLTSNFSCEAFKEPKNGSLQMGNQCSFSFIVFRWNTLACGNVHRRIFVDLVIKFSFPSIDTSLSKL